jgi:dephospho-CoA kinase
MFILGIVGSPAGGKSTVARRLEEHGATWVNADLIARSVLDHADIAQQLISHFGSEIADSSGQIDRSALAARVFGDDVTMRGELTYLESLVHPRTKQIITQQIQAAQAHQDDDKLTVIVLDIPLMFESGWDRSCDEIWCVDSQRDLRLQRTKTRGWDDDELGRREANQMNMEDKKRLSNQVIENNGTLEQLNETIDQLWGSIYERQNATPVQDKQHCLQET